MLLPMHLHKVASPRRTASGAECILHDARQIGGRKCSVATLPPPFQPACAIDARSPSCPGLGTDVTANARPELVRISSDRSNNRRYSSCHEIRSISCRDLVSGYLQRIEAYNHAG